MTNFTKHLMLAAAACTIAAGSAAAQTYQAEIPFTFRAAGVNLAPGRYEISVSRFGSGTRYLKVRDMESHKAVLMTPNGLTGEKKGPGEPTLRFACVEARCALSALWVGGWEGAYTFATPAAGKHEMARIETVVMSRAKETD